MRIMTILGTRPEIIRLSRIIPRLDALCEHVLVHTGQNADPRLSDIFFDELDLRPPDHNFGVCGATFGEQIGQIIAASEHLLRAVRPSRLLLLGDTNSALSAIVAKRLGIPVFHLEAGNRCYDDRVPEEVNRRVIDHSSDLLLPYTWRARANLVREGIPEHRIHVVGNPIYEVLQHIAPAVERSDILTRLSLRPEGYFLVTLHRQENVDQAPRLRALLAALGQLHHDHGLPVVVSLHPRTRDRLARAGLDAPDGVRLMPPFGLIDFVALERQARCVLSDSGTVQEECAIFGVPNVTLRDTTERPETLECGSGMLAGADPAAIQRCVRAVLDGPRAWQPPTEYTLPTVSDTVVRIVLGHFQPARESA
jgi:UDP-N-acetylglucosamine 2-epimerase (non-hydrolysing)